MKAVDEARRNTAVDALYQEIEANTPIVLREVAGVSWSSTTQNGQTIIEVGSARNPAAALYHELLHAFLKINGYRQYNQVAIIRDNCLELKGILEAIDNELQHHRMYVQFTKVGFKPEEVYDDDDKSTFDKIRKELRKMDHLASAGDCLLKFLTVIAPGGHGSVVERQKLRNFLMSRCAPAVRKKLEKIETLVATWATAVDVDPATTIRAIIDSLGDYEGAWIGASQNLPTDGWFTGAPFSVADAEAFRNGR
jgi:hypothetical protein